MNTKTLIRNIENLSATLDQKQLTAFLDIMDAVAAMANEAQELSKQDQSTRASRLSQVAGGLH
ncbi:hypothetical protein [Alteromonas gilva]|uniref:Uncharacterized protein n=1 Tax=Alteromonas gilva TaxID=2987522 RepID=A0ABT5L2V7_9ALTE|nr:hypothetical protein [Alteromonas gilva]MDC8830816.1 hypothetical protein [Alteromonas gilva]